MDVLDLLDRPIAFHRCLVDVCGSVNSALMLCQLFYWSKRTKDKEGWIYKSQEEWKDETGLSRKEQESARKRLRSVGFIEEKKKGTPCRLFYRVDYQRVKESLIEKEVNDRLDCTKGADLIALKVPASYTETTAETTTKNITASQEESQIIEASDNVKQLQQAEQPEVVGCPTNGQSPNPPIPSPPLPSTSIKAAVARLTWLTEYDDIWHKKTGGHIPFAQSARVFKALEKEYGRDRVVWAWRRYVFTTDERFISVNNFLKKPGIHDIEVKQIKDFAVDYKPE